jgi:hypothetical protein
LVIYIIWMIITVPYKGNASWLVIDGRDDAHQYPTMSNVIYTFPYAIWWFVGMEVRRRWVKAID